MKDIKQSKDSLFLPKLLQTQFLATITKTTMALTKQSKDSLLIPKLLQTQFLAAITKTTVALI
jgi:hypothetical protein